MLVSIDEIKVRKRIRKDPGDLEALKESLKRYGLLNPVTINSKNELIAGQRRLEAAKQLGWTSINAVVVDTLDKAALLEMELEENTQRLPFTDAELLDGYTALEKLRNPGFFVRIWKSLKTFFSETVLLKNGNRFEERLDRAKKLSFLLPAGIVLVAAGMILAKYRYITGIMHSFFDIAAVVAIVVGGFSVVRVISGRRA